MEDRERWYSFVLFRTPHEIYLPLKLIHYTGIKRFIPKRKLNRPGLNMMLPVKIQKYFIQFRYVYIHV
jgi:hypothetical protein